MAGTFDLYTLALQLKAVGGTALLKLLGDVDTKGKKAAGSINVMSGALKLVGTAVAAIGVGALFKRMIDEASQAEQALTNLQTAVQNTGGNVEALAPQLDEAANNLQKLTRFGDDAAREALTILTTTSGSATKALQNLSLAADIAVARNISLRTAADLVGRALAGQTSTLSRYGIVVKEGADVMELLRRRFGGFAERDGKTFQGRLEQIRNAFADVLEALGKAVLGAGDTGSAMEALTAKLKSLEAWITANRDQIAALVRTIGDAIVWIGEHGRLIVGVLAAATAFRALSAAVALARAAMIAFTAAGAAASGAGALAGLLALLNPVTLGIAALSVVVGVLAHDLLRVESAAQKAKRELEALPLAQRVQVAEANASLERIRQLRASRAAPAAGGTAPPPPDEEAARKAAEERIKLQNDEIAALSTLGALNALRAEDLRRLRTLERDLTSELNRGNVTLERRAEITQNLDKLTQARITALGPTILPEDIRKKVEDDLRQRYPEGLTLAIKARLKVILDKTTKEQVPEWIQELRDRMGAIVTSAFEGVFAALGKAIAGGGLRDLGRAILGGLGAILVEMGKTLIGFGALMKALAAKLANPITAGPAAIAIGAALILLGSTLGAIATGGGGGRGAFGGGGFGGGRTQPPEERVTQIILGPSSTTRAAGLQPLPPINATIIGPHDPQAQRAIEELVTNIARRKLGG